MATPFLPRDPADMTALVRAYPLCWVVSDGADGHHATPLPLLPEPNDAGGVASLLGHFARSNPQVIALERAPAATILCMGPQGYIAPRLVSNPIWGPTWNYAVTRFDVDIHFVPEENDAAISQLAAALEGDMTDPWTPARMGPRYDQLAKHIVAFRATVRAAHPRFKLGQDENDTTFREIVTGLADETLANWMRSSRD
ncbi:MAG: FMN-binding negative transcriptional regulator [Sphingomonas sp.]